MEAVLDCPHCQSQLHPKTLPPAGTKVRCPRCTEVFVIDPPAAAPVRKKVLPVAVAIPDPTLQPRPVAQPEQLAGHAGMSAGLSPLLDLSAGLHDPLASVDGLAQNAPLLGSYNAEAAEEPIHPAVWWAMIGGGLTALAVLATIVSLTYVRNQKNRQLAQGTVKTAAAKTKTAGPSAAAKSGKSDAAEQGQTAGDKSSPPLIDLDSPSGQAVLVYKLPAGTTLPYDTTSQMTFPKQIPPPLGGTTMNISAKLELKVSALDSATAQRLGSEFQSPAARSLRLSGEVRTNVNNLPQTFQGSGAMTSSGQFDFEPNINQDAQTALASLCEKLPPGNEREWTVRRSRVLRTPTGTNITMTENITYRLGSLDGDRQTVHKTVSTDVLQMGKGSIQVTGQGTFVFDRALGYLVSFQFDGVTTMKEGRVSADLKMSTQGRFVGTFPVIPPPIESERSE